MASVVQICNGALNQLGASTILTLTEDSKNARLCNARYENVRDAVFRHHPWNCLQKRLALPADTEAPAWGFTKQFTLPADCLRLLRIFESPTSCCQSAPPLFKCMYHLELQPFGLEMRMQEQGYW